MRSSTPLVPVLATLLGLGTRTTTGKPTATEQEPPSKRDSLPTVTASGNAFWTGETRFYVRGLDYQPGGSSAMADPLADPAVCKRDIAQFKKLGINTVRVYITDNSADHVECMAALAAAGIYVIIDANNPLYSINRLDPGPSYNTKYLQSVFASVDEFARYGNTLAFFSGNEVVNDNVTSTLAARYVKAVTRDMRSYLRSRGHRAVPVGYSAADVAQNRMQLAHYMNCGTDDERSDFFAFNDYSWCNSNFQSSGWDQKVKNFTGYGIPIFLSEYGCLTNGRSFSEIAALMSTDMTPVYSGGLMYEYALEANGYGIAKIQGDAAVQEEDGFAQFADALKANPAPTADGGKGGAEATSHGVACPTRDGSWLVEGTLLPAIPEGGKQMLSEGAGKGPGLKGDGSQNAGEGLSTGNATPGSGTVSATGTPAGSENAAAAGRGGGAAGVEVAPFVVAGLVLVLTMGGTLLL